MMSAQRGGAPKADAIRKLSKGRLREKAARGRGSKIRKICRHHMHMAPYEKTLRLGRFFTDSTFCHLSVPFSRN